MKVAFITTIAHNVGDDFVRDGIAYLLRQAIGPFESRLVHKHFPVTARPGAERMHLNPLVRTLRGVRGLRGDRLSRWLDALPLPKHGDAILDCDLLVQSGAPVYWLNADGACQNNEWYGPLIRRRWQQRQTRAPLLNIGAGACQPFHSDGSEFAAAPGALRYIREFFEQCALTTLRDALSERILTQAGLAAPRLPCPSLYARCWHGIQTAAGDYVALNFMGKGGHYDLDGAADFERWRLTFSEVLRSLSQHERCVLVCHDHEEEKLAAQLFPEVERFHATDAAQYLRFYANARSGILNRVHGAFALASFGRPAVIIGADSRARMGEEIGLSVFPVSTATTQEILAAHAEMRLREVTVAERMADLTAETERRYLRLLRDATPHCRS